MITLLRLNGRLVNGMTMVHVELHKRNLIPAIRPLGKENGETKGMPSPDQKEHETKILDVWFN